jgi:hypothetical protein
MRKRLQQQLSPMAIVQSRTMMEQAVTQIVVL